MSGDIFKLLQEVWLGQNFNLSDVLGNDVLELVENKNNLITILSLLLNLVSNRSSSWEVNRTQYGRDTGSQLVWESSG